MLCLLHAVADSFDFVGFLSLAFFNGFVASLQQEVLASWLLPFVMLTGCGVVSLISLISAFLLEDYDARK